MERGEPPDDGLAVLAIAAAVHLLNGFESNFRKLLG